MMHSTLRRSLVLGMSLVVGAAVSATAQNVTPNFGTTVPGSWVTDRYQPTTFGLTNGTHGRNGVLNIGITSAGNLANRPAGYQSTFYNTQGMQMALGAGPGSYLLTADLWVSSAWAANAEGSNNGRRTDMWGVAVNGSNSPWDYPIIGFSNGGGTGLFRGYDVNTGAWQNFANPVNYNAWNTLAITWNSTSALYSYFVNGSLAGTVQGDGVAVGINAIIMQAYNFNDPAFPSSGVNYGSTDYTAEWSNTQAVPEPATLMLLGTGLMSVVGVGAVRRRKNRSLSA